MDEIHTNAREQFFAARRILASSSDSIQTRLIDATPSILQVAIDEFEGAHELKIRFAPILDPFGCRSG
jgi:hypothetical protein